MTVQESTEKASGQEIHTMNLRKLRLPVGRHGEKILRGIFPSHEGALVTFFV